MGLEVKNLTHKRGDFGLKNINFKVRDNEYFMILGPNGAGKSTLIKNMLGLYTPTSGEIFINKQPASNLPPEKRNVGYIPQELALFPHLSVRKNINYGMKAAGVDQSKRNKKCNRISKQLNIQELLERKPEGLSGGEKQKVALARALVNKPQALFLDEPFASIDRASRHSLWKTLRRLLISVE
ncbi:MAG: ABC transporter ATP-binding protein, partial [bacterium]